MIVTLPWPSKELSPNARAHWGAKSVASKKAREIGHYAALEAAGSRLGAVRASLAGEGKIALTVRFYPPDRRHRDDDNMIGSAKSFRDGIADALQVNDRRFRPHYFFEEPAKPGRIEVEIAAGQSGENYSAAAPSFPLKKSGPSACGNTVPGPDHNAVEVRHDF